MSNKNRSIRFPMVAVGLLLLGLAGVPGAYAADPCCSVTAIDAKTSVVTARVIDSGRTFQFEVKEATLLQLVKVGQKIVADLNAMTVALPPARLGDKPVSVPILKAEPTGATGSAMMQNPPKTKVTADDLRGEGGCGLITAGNTYNNDQDRTRRELQGCCRNIGPSCDVQVIGIKDHGSANTDQDDVPRSFQCICH